MVHAYFITFLKVTLLKREIPEKLVLYGTMFPTISHSSYRRTFSDYTSTSSKAGKGKMSDSSSELKLSAEMQPSLPCSSGLAFRKWTSWGKLRSLRKKSQWLRKLLRHLNLNTLEFLKAYCFSALSLLRVFYSPHP